MEKQSNHPLASAIIKHFPGRGTLSLEVKNFVGQGLSATYKNQHYRIGKPTFFEKVSPEYNQLKERLAQEGKTVVYIGREDWVVGLIALMDIGLGVVMHEGSTILVNLNALRMLKSF